MSPPAPDNILSHGLYYASAMGWRVVPIIPGKKWPPLKAWQDAATTDPEIIEGWFGGQYAGYGIGIVHGHRSGSWLLDVDVSDGKQGPDTIRALMDRHGRLPETPTAVTGSGGVHKYWAYPDDGQIIASGKDTKDVATSRIGPGCDYRGEGGQGVAPPTTTKTGFVYRWAEGRAPWEIPMAPAPDWLVEMVAEKPGDLYRPVPANATPSGIVLPDGSVFRSDRESYGEIYNAETTWDHILGVDGWTMDHTDRDGTQYWVRPGKDARQGCSATVNYAGTDHLKMFSTSIAWLPEGTSCDRFGYMVRRDYGGDFAAAARALDRRPRSKPDEGLDLLGPNSTPKLVEPTQVLGRHIHLTAASDIEMLPVKWLMDLKVALGEIALLAGREGIGKSTVMYTIIAWITRGLLEGVYYGQPKAVLVCATEDSWAHTIVPRLKAANADLTRVFRIEVISGDGYGAELSLPADLVQLEQAVIDKQAALIVLDPLMSRLSAKLDTHKDQEVRQALEPLKKIADRTKVTVLGIIHVNKSTGTDPLNLIMGSRAFSSVVRHVLFCLKDSDDDRLRYFGNPKNNLGPEDLPAMRYYIEGATVGQTVEGPVVTARIIWDGLAPCGIREIMETNADAGENRSATAEAAEWLREFLESMKGSASRTAILKEAQANAHSKDAIQRAFRKLRLVADNIPGTFPCKKSWRLPGYPGPDDVVGDLLPTPAVERLSLL